MLPFSSPNLYWELTLLCSHLHRRNVDVTSSSDSKKAFWGQSADSTSRATSFQWAAHDHRRWERYLWPHWLFALFLLTTWVESKLWTERICKVCQFFRKCGCLCWHRERHKREVKPQKADDCRKRSCKSEKCGYLVKSVMPLVIVSTD